ncbi:MAG: hypothetical protein Q7R79_02705 [bacterium]|nr:hypothetical protein [bacterium]
MMGDILSPLATCESISPIKEEIKITKAKTCVASANFEIEVNDLLENIRLILQFILSRKREQKKKFSVAHKSAIVKRWENIDFSKIVSYEKIDETQGAKELACVSGVCEI